VVFLIFQLRAPLSSWGTVAVGEYRGTYEYPTESSLMGLLGAALGIRREDEGGHSALRDSYDFAMGIVETGSMLRDYHTAQVPRRTALKGRPQATRLDELSVPKEELHTVLSTRDYRQGAASLVAVHARANAPYDLETLTGALQKPRFVLYVGRKTCPVGAPLWPQIITSNGILAAFEEYRMRFKDAARGSLLEPLDSVVQLAWGDGLNVGVTPDFSVPRKDRVVRRLGWQFADRTEYTKILGRRN
jgi:CRISPR system Cascade subunit CasD